jgi:hypothetical protein
LTSNVQEKTIDTIPNIPILNDESIEIQILPGLREQNVSQINQNTQNMKISPTDSSAEPKSKLTDKTMSILLKLPDMMFQKVKSALKPKPKQDAPKKLKEPFHYDFFINDFLHKDNKVVYPKPTFEDMKNQSTYKIQEEDSLDMDVKNALYQIQEAKTLQTMVRERPINTKIQDIADDGDEMSDGYETDEDESAPVINISKGAALWEIVRKDFIKKKLVRTFRGKGNIIQVVEPEPIEQESEGGEEYDYKIQEDPKLYYLVCRRKWDLKKYTHLYIDKTIDPLTHKLVYDSTPKPIIGISPEPDRKRMLGIRNLT